MEDNVTAVTKHPVGPATVGSLTLGFVLAIGLTLAAYFVAVDHWLYGMWVVVAIVALAVAQLLVQLIFFLHLGREGKPRWNLAAFFFMLIFLFIIIAGSLWIMYNLNYNMTQMSPKQMDSYMKQQSNAGF